MNDLTAANRTLPFGTKVRVTDLSTGRSVDVTINDRGPFVAGRIIDLSRAAARAIGLTAQGVAKVRLHVLKVGNNRRVPGPPALEAAARAREARRRAAAAKSPPARVETLAAASNFMPTAGGTTPAAGGASGKPANPVVVVQVGSFHDLANAVRLRNLLAQDGFDPIYEKWHSYTRVVLVSVPLAHLPTVRKRLDRVGITSILVRRN